MSIEIILRVTRLFLADENGPTAVEYAVLLAVIVVVAAMGISLVGQAAYESLWMAVEALD